jgi:hypothetical protein
MNTILFWVQWFGIWMNICVPDQSYYRVFHTNWVWVSSLEKIFSLYLRCLWISHLLLCFQGAGLPIFFRPQLAWTPCRLDNFIQKIVWNILAYWLNGKSHLNTEIISSVFRSWLEFWPIQVPDIVDILLLSSKTLSTLKVILLKISEIFFLSPNLRWLGNKIRG